MRVAAIVAAGGVGRRLSAGRPKQLLELGDRSILQRSVEALVRHPAVADVVVALPVELAQAPPGWLATSGARIVAGGERRQDSVARAFRALVRADIVLVHDAARPFVSADTITRTIEAAAAHGAAIAAQPVRDTVKRVHADGGLRRIVETLPRDAIFLAQTPQAFRWHVLEDAVRLGEAGHDATDEAALAEQAGHPVHVVEGPADNVKITTAEDLEAARRRAEDGTTRMRVGTGYDLHRLVEGRRLVLGGVDVPFERGAAGHSDADVVCHAVTDAVLGALAAGDIGRHFPDTDPAYAGASSVELLRRAVALVHAAGYRVVNVDVVVVLERPKVAPFVDAMRARLAGALQVDPGAVSVKGKTNEGVDAVGRGEAIAAHAVALVAAS